MRLTVTTFLSTDGVYQGPGGPTEDPSGGFDRGGWLVPHFDEATGVFMTEVFQKVDAFLFGRRTYEIMAAHWPNVTDEEGDETASRLNTLPKYVVSTTLRDPEWQNSTVVSGDIAAEVIRLKEMEGGELQVHGSGTLVRTLLEHDLVDELRLIVFPVIVGAGRRLFPENGVAAALRLVQSRSTPSGVVIQVYEPSGRPEFGTVES
jgi:dihydrofolate reductase